MQLLTHALNTMLVYLFYCVKQKALFSFIYHYTKWLLSLMTKVYKSLKGNPVSFENIYSQDITCKQSCNTSTCNKKTGMHKCNIISAVLTKTYIIHTSTANTHFYCHFDRCIEETPWVNLLAVHRVKESSPCMHGWPQLAARGLQREPPAFVLPSPPACLETPGRSFFLPLAGHCQPE